MRKDISIITIEKEINRLKKDIERKNTLIEILSVSLNALKEVNIKGEDREKDTYYAVYDKDRHVEEDKEKDHTGNSNMYWVIYNERVKEVYPSTVRKNVNDSVNQFVKQFGVTNWVHDPDIKSKRIKIEELRD